MCVQITADALHPQYIRQSSMDQLGILSADLFRRIGVCRLPFRIGPKVAPFRIVPHRTQFFACWSSITDLRIAQNGWVLTSDVNRARVRLTPERYRGQMGSECEPRNSAGCFLHDPSDDESLPQVSEESLLTQLSCPELGPKWSKVPNPPTPKRDAQAPPSAEPDPKAQRVEPSSFSKSDLGFSHRHAMSPPAAYLITAAADQSRLAGNGPTCGWPTSAVPLPDRNPAEATHDPVLNARNFRNVAADFGWVTGAAMDPLSYAPEAAKAVMVSPGEFRALGEHARLTRPHVCGGFQVWALKNRAAPSGKPRRDWRLGAR